MKMNEQFDLDEASFSNMGLVLLAATSLRQIFQANRP